MDTDGQMPDHWGTPIAYAAKEKGGEDVFSIFTLEGSEPGALGEGERGEKVGRANSELIGAN